MGNQRAKGGFTLRFGGAITLQMQGRRAMSMMITYTDLIQTGIFIVALVGLCYKIFKEKKK